MTNSLLSRLNRCFQQALIRIAHSVLAGSAKRWDIHVWPCRREMLTRRSGLRLCPSEEIEEQSRFAVSHEVLIYRGRIPGECE